MNGIDPGQTPEEFYSFCTSFEDGLFSRYAELLRRLEVSSRSFLRPNILDDLVSGGVPLIAAGDLVAEFREKFQKSKNLGIFWDYENIMPDFNTQTGTEIMEAIQRRMSIFGEVMEVHVYVPPSKTNRALQLPGAVVHSVPTDHRHEVADKMIIVDAIAFAFSQGLRDSIVCIISCDSDFSSLISKLQMLGVRTIAVTKDGAPVRSMRSVSMLNLSWPSDFFPNTSGGVTARGFGSGNYYGTSRPGTPARKLTPNANNNNNTNFSNRRPSPLPAAAVGNTTSNSNANNNSTSTTAAAASSSPTSPPRIVSNLNAAAPVFSTTHAKSPTKQKSIPRKSSPAAAASPSTKNNNNNNKETEDASVYNRTHQNTKSMDPSSPYSPVFRKNSMLMRATPAASFTDDEINTSDDNGTQFLVKLLTKMKEETGNRRIPQWRVGAQIRKTLGGVSFHSLIKNALNEGLIEVGDSSSGLAWIGLAKKRRNHHEGPNGNDDDTSTVISSSSATTHSSGMMMGARSGIPHVETQEYIASPTALTSSAASLAPLPRSSAASTAQPNLSSSASSTSGTNNNGPAIPKPRSSSPSSNHSSRHDNQNQNQQQTAPPTSPAGTYYLSYRMFKHRPNSRPLLSLKPEDVAPFEIIDTPDPIDPEKFTRRAFGPFKSVHLAERFGVSLKESTLAVPRVLYYRPV